MYRIVLFILLYHCHSFIDHNESSWLCFIRKYFCSVRILLFNSFNTSSFMLRSFQVYFCVSCDKIYFSSSKATSIFWRSFYDIHFHIKVFVNLAVVKFYFGRFVVISWLQSCVGEPHYFKKPSRKINPGYLVNILTSACSEKQKKLAMRFAFAFSYY
jgi:hypothetical protein